ncbi:MAG: glycosyltransferase [Alphaproteobacteria bacterium]|nr:glycosyltransferase [Alphaproteobacteria bacterium]
MCRHLHLRPADRAESLLDGLARQQGGLRFQVVVVDNGTVSAQGVALERAAAGALSLTYVRLRERGLVAARNRSLALARESGALWIACLDDDEVPCETWLSALHARARETGADLVYGPVLPDFEVLPPRWAVAGGFFVKTGEIACSSNLLLRTAVLGEDPRDWYQPAFGAIGGEDRDFMARLERGGARVATADDALVREHVPAARLRLGYMFQRGLRDGYVEVTLLRQVSDAPARLVLSALGVAGKKSGFLLYHLVSSLASSAHFASASPTLEPFAASRCACPAVAGGSMAQAAIRPETMARRPPHARPRPTGPAMSASPPVETAATPRICVCSAPATGMTCCRRCLPRSRRRRCRGRSRSSSPTMAPSPPMPSWPALAARP